MKLLRYIIFNGIFAYSIYEGLYNGNNGFENVAVFMGWFLSITSFIIILFMQDPVLEKIERKNLIEISQRSVPEWVDVLFDLCITISFVYKEYIALPMFYIIHMLIISAYHSKLKEYLNKTLDDFNEKP